MIYFLLSLAIFANFAQIVKNAIFDLFLDRWPANLDYHENKQITVEIHPKSTLYLAAISFRWPTFWKKL